MKLKSLKYFLLTFVFIASTCQIIAHNSSLFNIDENRIKSELQYLVELESFLQSHADFTLLDIKNMTEFQHIELSSNDSSSLTINTGPPLGIPSFIWGLCLSIPGVVLVYSLTADNEEMKKAMLGCVIGTGLYGGCYALTYGLSSF